MSSFHYQHDKAHELRSPLHGILASVEFLIDTTLSSFQELTINIIDACGKTLLDTINHVLDYSKINSFEKTWQESTKHEVRQRFRARSTKPDPLCGSALATSPPPLLQLFGVTDVSCVLEQVIEGITAGHTYGHMDLTDVSKAARGRSPTAVFDGHQSVPDSPEDDAVEVILDIEPENYVVLTQPGAIRRIISNTFGNGLK
jgi:signal transduction histidine kinase